VTYRLTDLDESTVAVLVQGGASETSLRHALQPLTDKRAEVAVAESKLSAIESEILAITQDQNRVRENMKALRGSAEEKSLLQRYTKQLNAQEDRLGQLESEKKRATDERDAKRAEFASLAANLTFDLG